MAENLFEAFHELDSLNEEVFDLNNDGIEELKRFRDGDMIEFSEIVIDPMVSESDLDSDVKDVEHIDDVILNCVVCQSKIFKPKSEVYINEEETLANVGDECPLCHSIDGYKIIGQVEKFDDSEETEEKVETEEDEVKETELEEKEDIVESLKESNERDDIDADADDKKERIRKALKRRLDDADSLRDERRKSAKAKFRKAQDDIDADRDDKLERKGLKESKQLNEGFRGCKKVRMIWHGEWSDPELYYKDEDGKEYFANYYDVEDSIWNYYQEEAEYAKKNNDKYAKELNSKYDWSSLNEKDDTDFNKFVVDNENSVIEDVIEFSESNNYDHSEEIDESCKSVKESVSKRDDINAEADNKKELSKKRFMRAKDDADADKDYRLKKAGLKESDKPAATSIEDAQKWVDYDMKKYGKISGRTNRLVRRAGFQIVKDTYGDYEVIAGDYEKKFNEDYSYLDGHKVKVFYDFYEAQKEANRLGLKESEYGDKDSKYSYCLWNKTGNRNEYEDIYAIYTFEDGKPRALTEEEIDEVNVRYELDLEESLKEDTVKQGNYWVNKGEEGTHGKFKTKKAADEQRKAMFARGFKEELEEENNDKEFDILGWTLEITYPEDRLYSGPRYWLYNPRGLGGSLTFYSKPETILDDYTKGKQVLGFEGQEIPKSVLRALINKYAKGVFDNSDLQLKEKVEEEKIYKAYGWFLNGNNELEISIIDKDGNEKLIDTIPNCEDKTKIELDMLADETIYKNGYKKLEEKLIQGKSDETVRKNTETEIKAGKDPKQAYAIAKSIQRKNMKEDFERVDIETDRERMTMTAEEGGKVTVTTEPKEDMKEEDKVKVVPISKEVSDELLSQKEGAGEDGFEDIEIDEFDEEEFDRLGEGFLKRVYENVDSYKTTKGSTNEKQIKLEGVITFKSGKKAKTNFVFEAKTVRNGKVKLFGENLQFTKGKKAFVLTGGVNNGKLVCESLSYNYKGKDAKTGNTKRLCGTISK